MSTSRMPGEPQSPARTIGSSLALSLIIVGVVVLILAAGAYSIFRDNDSDDAAAIPSPSGTSELVAIGGTSTPTANASPTAGFETPTVDDLPTATIPSPTPSPSLTPAEQDEDDPTPTAEEELPSATEEVVEPSATEVEEPEPEPTSLPLEGEFGFLPPAQLPSGGVSSTLELEFQLGMSLESLPSTGTVYLLSWPTYSFADVELARDRLALQGEVVEEGVGVYRVESDRGSLFVSPTEIIFRAAGFTEGTELPDDAEAIEIAREWVDLSSFIGDDMDSGAVVGRDEESQRIVVKFRPLAPQPNLAPNPAATVNLGPGGTVLEVRIAWPSALTPSEYGFSNPLDIWQAVQAGQGFLEADITSVFATGQLTGAATIVDYTTAHTLAGSPAASQYLVPLIRFEGFARIDQTGDQIPITVSIPVVYFQEGTAG